LIFLPIKTYVNDRPSSLPKMNIRDWKMQHVLKKKSSTRPSFLLRKAWFWPIFAPAVKHLEMAAIWRWCALGSIWCVSPGYCHGSAKGCHHGHPQPLKPIPEVQHSVERKRNSSSFPSHWGKWPKRKWFGRADRLQFLQISPFSPPGWPDTDPSYSGWIETFDTLGPGSKHKTLKFIVNFSFSKFAHALETEPLLLTDQSLGPLFPSPSLCGSPLHSWTCFKGR